MLLLLVSFRKSTLIGPRLPFGAFTTLLIRLSFLGPPATLTERLLAAYELVRRKFDVVLLSAILDAPFGGPVVDLLDVRSANLRFLEREDAVLCASVSVPMVERALFVERALMPGLGLCGTRFTR